jgi:hypothetical protein
VGDIPQSLVSYEIYESQASWDIPPRNVLGLNILYSHMNVRLDA